MATQEELLNEGTPEGCEYFLFIFAGYIFLGLGFLLGVAWFVVVLVQQLISGKMNLWFNFVGSIVIWAVFGLLSALSFRRSRKIKEAVMGKGE